MSYQAIFERYELKYLLTKHQQQRILKAMAPYMKLDTYGRTSIRNIYFDTSDYRLIRHSIEKPAYKEKLRIRSYCKTEPGNPVFVELKKKYKSIVYKRRLSIPEEQAVQWFADGRYTSTPCQIAEEIQYFLEYYQTLHPVLFLSCEREAYYSLDGSDFRVTFDDHILCREDLLSLEEDVGGIPLMNDDTILMEIKTAGGIPLWMAHTLSQERIYKTSFSKYGTAYQTILYPKHKGEHFYA